MHRAVTAERDGEYGLAIDTALAGMPHVDAALQFEKRYLKLEASPVPLLQLVFRCAPPLFRSDALDRVETFLGEQKRVEKNAAIDVRAELAAARARMVLAALMWDEIEAGRYDAAAVRRLPAADENEIRNAWDRLGVLVASHADGRSVWRLRTRLDEPVQARCFNCGRRSKARKLIFLDAGTCPRCQATAHFAILAGPNTGDGP